MTSSSMRNIVLARALCFGHFRTDTSDNTDTLTTASKQTVNVGAFSKSAGGLNNVPIVDTMLAYDCERTNQVYLLVLRNVLYIESMDDNLIRRLFCETLDLL